MSFASSRSPGACTDFTQPLSPLKQGGSSPSFWRATSTQCTVLELQCLLNIYSCWGSGCRNRTQTSHFLARVCPQLDIPTEFRAPLKYFRFWTFPPISLMTRFSLSFDREEGRAVLNAQANLRQSGLTILTLVRKEYLLRFYFKPPLWRWQTETAWALTPERKQYPLCRQLSRMEMSCRRSRQSH